MHSRPLDSKLPERQIPWEWTSKPRSKKLLTHRLVKPLGFTCNIAVGASTLGLYKGTVGKIAKKLSNA